MRIISSTGKLPSDILVIDMTQEQFNQLITVVSAARSAAQEGGTDFFSIEQISKIVNFYDAFKNIKAVRTPQT